MNVQVLIDEVVRQTTVLIAQLSTTAGARAPLSHIADQVFLELARELESQGIGRKVVADMFGMLLRSYQMKVRRLNESEEKTVGSLWQQLYADLSSSSSTRQELEQRHRSHDKKQIASALHDMVQSGLAYCSGRGQETLYGLTSDTDREHLSELDARRVRKDLCWYLVASGSQDDEQGIAIHLKCSAELVREVVAELESEGHLSRKDGRLEAARFEVAIGSEQGWETSVLDHFRAVTTAIAAKLATPIAEQSDVKGGGTRSFIVHESHPHYQEVLSLLSETRARSYELWRRVSTYNEAVSPPETADRVTFYFGQNVINGKPTEIS